jgi:hypothetical protein
MATFIETPERIHTFAQIRRWTRYRRELAGFIIDVLCELVSERATGRLTINLSEGYASSAEFREEAQITDPS